MATSFDQIKDTAQLQDFLQKHAASSGAQNAGPLNSIVKKDTTSAANNYKGMNSQKKGVVQAQATDRYEKQSTQQKRLNTDIQEARAAAAVDEDECRSIRTELDYTKKDASRHIVKDKMNPATLRQRLLRNLEGVRKNIAIQPSMASSSMNSIRSRLTNVTARASQANKAVDAATGE